VARALILGGTGAIGLATARRLLAAGWEVDLTGRDPARMPVDVAASGGRFLPADRRDPAQVRGALADGVSLLVDCACFTAADAELLLPLLDDVDATVMISSKAVYVDGDGNHSNSDAPPRFAGPIREDQPTLAPAAGDHTTREGYGPNKVAAERVLLDSGHPVTVLRPSKVHGAGARRPREWVFVKRVLDRRPLVVLAHGGRGTDHLTAAANVAALIEMVTQRPGARILNCADPDAPSGLEIAGTIAALLEHVWEEVLIPHGAPADERLGAHPWDSRPPILLDTAASGALGYVPAGDYAATVAEEVAWLLTAAAGDGPDRPPAADDPFFAPFLDYAAEDRYLATRSG
jgi:nucleoside-diphosphate-sugar epimerase